MAGATPIKLPMSPRPNSDFLRGILAAYALYLAWINLGSFWLGLGLWVKYHRLVPIQLGGSAALFAAFAFSVVALAFPGRRRLLAAAILLTITALLPVAILFVWGAGQLQSANLGAFLRNEAVRLAVAAGAWHLFRSFGKAVGR